MSSLTADPPRNYTLYPDKAVYYRGDTIQVNVQANPAPKQYKWTHVNTNKVSN